MGGISASSYASASPAPPPPATTGAEASADFLLGLTPLGADRPDADALLVSAAAAASSSYNTTSGDFGYDLAASDATERSLTRAAIRNATARMMQAAATGTPLGANPLPGSATAAAAAAAAAAATTMTTANP